MPTATCQHVPLQTHVPSRTVSERVDRHQYVSDICLRPWSVAVLVCCCLRLWRGVGASRSTHVYLAILESLLQVLVDGLVGDLADERKIRDANFLLFGRLEDGLGCELLGWCSSGGLSTSGLARCAVGFPLHTACVSGMHSRRATFICYHG